MSLRLAFAIVLTVAAGCGLKGPLYLPETATNVEVRPAEPPADSPTEEGQQKPEENAKEKKNGADAGLSGTPATDDDRGP